MRYLSVLPLAALALAGCEQARTPTVEPSASPEILESAPAPTTPSDIPLAVQGRWGLVPADCTSTQGDAKGLLVIDDTTLKFYESRATLREIREFDNDGIEATFDFTGEGQEWTLDLDLQVKDGGKTLIRKDAGEGAAPEPLEYTRCA